MEAEFLSVTPGSLEVTLPKDSQPDGTRAMIRRLEEISIDAWPAFQTALYDGWVIRFADGFSRRSNSIIPLYSSTVETREKIRVCESLYRERGLRTVFKMTAQSEPRELDGILAAEGYASEAETSVQRLPLDSWSGLPAGDVVLQEDPSDDWLSALCKLNGYELRHYEAVRKLTSLIQSPRAFASIRREGKIIACGLGILRQGFVGLFDIVVDAAFRRNGMGKQIVANLLGWGKEKNAANAFLQVMTNNPNAMTMYAGLGFREEYKYVYRVKE